MNTKKSVKILFISKNFYLGGVETLILRMAKWYQEKNIPVNVLCETMAHDIRKNFISENINIVDVEIINDKILKTKLEEYKKSCILNIYSFDFNTFLQIENARKRLDGTNSYLYVVHPNCLIKGRSLETTFVKYLYKSFYKNIIIKLLKNKNIIFMDEQTIQATQKYYNICITEEQSRIFRLPIFINPLNIDEINKKYAKEYFNILTITRAEFPFKGYLIGLIDDYQRIKPKYNNLKMSIISYGDGEKVIKEKISHLPHDIRNDINFIGKVSYDLINHYFDEANLYIGMGTTVLDAANNGVPSVVAACYTYENITCGYFWQKPSNLGYSEEKMMKTDELIEKVINMNFSEYVDLCRKNYKSFEKMYDINVIMKKIMSYENQKMQVVLSKCELLIFKVISKF